MGFQNQAVPLHTFEGAPAHQRSAKEELYLLVANQLFSGDSFYERQTDMQLRFRRLVQVVAQEPDEGQFIAALAVYARQQLMLRTTPTMLVCEAFLLGLPQAEETARLVWIRGDEHLEAMAYVQAMGQKYPKRFLRAVAARLNDLTERQAMRYAATGKGKKFSQRDALRITHARPRDARQAALFRSLTQGWGALSEKEKDLLSQTRAVREEQKVVSWEQLLSREGSTATTWAKAARHMGYMALLRNLRNLLTMKVNDTVLEQVAVRLSDPAEVERSQQLPFRFYSAYNALGKPKPVFGRVRYPRYVSVTYWERKRVKLPARGFTAMETALAKLGVDVPQPQPVVKSIRIPHHTCKCVGWRWERTAHYPRFLQRGTGPSKDVPEFLVRAIEDAMEHAARRLSPLTGRTAVFVDLSGSMYWPVSARSVVTRMDAACTLGGLIGRQAGCQVFAFGTSYTTVSLQDVPTALQAARCIQSAESVLGAGTYLVPAFEAAFQQDFDRLIVLTDEQVADHAWSVLKDYLDEHPHCVAYVINLAGYSPSMTAQHARLVTVGGFSERVLDWIGALELPDPVAVILGEQELKKTA